MRSVPHRPARLAARLGLALLLTTAVAAVAAPPASAHAAPKPGARCAMSGMVTLNHGTAFVCASATAGARPTWGKGLATKPSPLTLTDAWAKAADTGMTAAFGTLTNSTTAPIRVVAAISPASPVVQLHEVVTKDGQMVMQQRPGGLVIPAGGSVQLMPGGNHLMFMKLRAPVRAGDMVPLTLVAADGGLLRTKVMAKAFAGANESYSSGMQ